MVNTSPTAWPRLIEELRVERRASVRGLAIRAGIARNTLINFLNGTRDLRVGQLERILAEFGYELEALRLGGR